MKFTTLCLLNAIDAFLFLIILVNLDKNFSLAFVAFVAMIIWEAQVKEWSKKL